MRPGAAPSRRALALALALAFAFAAPADGADPGVAAAQRADGDGASGRSPRATRPRVARTEPGAPRLVVAARAATEVQPKSVNVSPDGSRVYVCNFGRPDRDNVLVYDADTLERVGSVSFPGNAVESVFSVDGGTLFVSNFRRHVVEVIDVATLTVRREIPVGAHPKFMVVSPDGRTLYVANYMDQSVSVVDLETFEELRRLPAGVQPRGMAVLPDGRLLVASFRSDYVQVWSDRGEQELARFDTCPFPRHLQVGPDATQVFVTCTLGSIGWYDIETGRRRGLSPTARNPRSLGISSDGRFVATANFTSSDVSLTDVARMTHRTSEVPGADQLVGLAIRPGTALRVYVTSWNTHELIALDPAQPVPPATGARKAAEAGPASALPSG